MTDERASLPRSAPAQRPAGRPRSPAFDRTAAIEAVVDLVCSHGFAGWSMRDLAAKLGVSTGTLTHHFASREELANEAMDFVYVLPADWDAIKTQPPMVQLAKMMRIFVLDSESKRRWWQFWLEYMAVAGRDEQLRVRHEQRYERQLAFFSRLIAQVPPPNRDAETDAVRLLAFGNGLAIQQLETPQSLSLALASSLVDEFQAALLGQRLDDASGNG